MRTEMFRRNVHLPSPSEFIARFPQYSGVQDAERNLFDLVVTPQNVQRAIVLTDILGLPAVTAVAKEVADQYQAQENWGFRKQLTGAILCYLMELNGYRKADKKRAVPREGWSRGEVYELVS
jgi:hypothetical protein